MTDIHDTTVEIILEIDGVKIVRNFHACHAPLMGETFAVELRMFKAVHRYWTTFDGNLVCCVIGKPVEMNGVPSRIDREFWKIMRHASNEPQWHWSGNFPIELTEVILDEKRIGD